MSARILITLLFVVAAGGLIFHEGMIRRRFSFEHIAAFACVTIALFSAPAALEAFFPHHHQVTAPRNACVNNLRQIDGAKEQWALEKKIAAGELCMPNEVDAYIKGGRPTCPMGGTYIYGKVDDPPRCSIQGHSL
jgi:hypothetical protein